MWVISLGGSKLVPDEVDEKFLERFKKMLDKNPGKKFVIITGGGATARRYIMALRKLGKKTKAQSMAGIGITRFHARFLTRFFGKRANKEIPLNMDKVKSLLNSNKIVVAGALRYHPNNTSDGTSAKLASFLNCPFINLTNVKGLYSKDPKEKGAKFIPRITWRKFDAITSKMKYEAGQHFVLDQAAAKIILKKKIPTYIVGDVSNIDKIINKKKFTGTLISG